MTYIFPSSQCTRCAHYQGIHFPTVDLVTQAVGFCAAFPTAIPMEIWATAFDHRQPHEGDHGIRWAPVAEGVVHPMTEDAEPIP